jgi:hypothetical protein
MLCLALLLIAHPMPHASGHLGVSRAISDGLWCRSLDPRIREIAMGGIGKDVGSHKYGSPSSL